MYSALSNRSGEKVNAKGFNHPSAVKASLIRAASVKNRRKCSYSGGRESGSPSCPNCLQCAAYRANGLTLVLISGPPDPTRQTIFATLQTSIFFHRRQPPDRTLLQDGRSGRWSFSSPPRRQNPNLYKEQHKRPSRAHTSQTKPSQSLK